MDNPAPDSARDETRKKKKKNKVNRRVASAPVGLSRMGARVRKRGFTERIVAEGGGTKSAKKNK